MIKITFHPESHATVGVVVCPAAARKIKLYQIQIAMMLCTYFQKKRVGHKSVLANKKNSDHSQIHAMCQELHTCFISFSHRLYEELSFDFIDNEGGS